MEGDGEAVWRCRGGGGGGGAVGFRCDGGVDGSLVREVRLMPPRQLLTTAVQQRLPIHCNNDNFNVNRQFLT